MAASLSLSNTVLNGSFAYTDTGVSASGTFSANDGTGLWTNIGFNYLF